MMQDIDQMLSFEVKKEIADRYFSFRKLIEDDIHAYDDMVMAAIRRLEQKIGFNLVRLYILLKDEQLIHDFFKVVGLDTKLFFDPYLMESKTIRKRVFAGRQAHGLSRQNRFRNMGFDTYEELVHYIEEYRINRKVAQDEQATIAEEINLFYRKNDLGTIMGFLRGLDEGGLGTSGPMQGGLTPDTGKSLEKKMRFTAPPPVDELLPDIPQVPPLKKVKGLLKPILDKAYKRQGEPEMRELVHP